MRDDLEKLRDIEGFPIGEDEDLLTLSDPPHYTAYPNPHLEAFVCEQQNKVESTGEYQREPYVEDEKFGRTDDVYRCHSYHTKVPPQAVEKYISHYTNPEDVVLDVFAGTGMTGVAAQRCGRRAVLIDLSPIATFIAANNCTDVESRGFDRVSRRILRDVKDQYEYLYQTHHSDGTHGTIVYTIWSDIVECPYCHTQATYWDRFNETPRSIRRQKRNKTHTQCHCGAVLENNEWLTVLDKEGKRVQDPVEISYRVGRKRYTKQPDAEDLDLISQVDRMIVPHWHPQQLYMHKGAEWGDQWRAGYHIGIETVADFYMKRNLLVLAALKERIDAVEETELRNKLTYVLTAALPRLNRLNRYMPEHNRHVGPLSGTLYLSKLPVEINVLDSFATKARQISRTEFGDREKVIVSTQSAADLSNIPDRSIDYVFVDPPFGDNLPYSELNFMWEAWLRVFTSVGAETTISPSNGRQLEDYRRMMLGAFRECYRVLKPGHWITVEFHNSRADVWNAIQESLSRAGFVVAQVVVLDKKKGTTKQLSYAGTVKNDLIINAYRPRSDLADQLLSESGRDLEYAFVKQHLTQLPVAANIERTPEMLYSKYLAYYVQRGYQVAYDSERFYRALSQWGFIELDGYWFVDEAQANEYEKRKAKLVAPRGKHAQQQQQLFISDEKSARRWLWNLLEAPQTYDSVYTAFVKALQTSEDSIPELKVMLAEGFILTNGTWKRPDALTREELEQKRQARLLRQFADYLADAQRGQAIKEVRKEAVLEGFTDAYRGGRYQEILTVGRKLPSRLVEESPDLRDFIEIAEAKLES